MYEGKVKSSRPSSRETRDKQPLGRDRDRSWYHRASVKFSWSQPMDPWTERQHTRMLPSMSLELYSSVEVTPAPVRVPTQRPPVASFTSVVG